jgi:hypothetical protein
MFHPSKESFLKFLRRHGVRIAMRYGQSPNFPKMREDVLLGCRIYKMLVKGHRDEVFSTESNRGVHVVFSTGDGHSVPQRLQIHDDTLALPRD